MFGLFGKSKKEELENNSDSDESIDPRMAHKVKDKKKVKEAPKLDEGKFTTGQIDMQVFKERGSKYFPLTISLFIVN